VALNLKLATAMVNAEADALNALFNGAKLQVYDGVQPATADTAVSTQTKGVEWTLPNPCWGTANAGGLTANAITDVTAVGSINPATWFRVVTSGGTPIMDGSVGTAGCNLNLDSANIVLGVTQHVTSWTHTVTK
jgi:hypothetical protein